MSIQGSNHRTAHASYTEESIPVSFDTSDHATLGHIQQQAQQKMSETPSGTRGLKNLSLDNIVLSTTDSTDNTLVTRDICKPGETIAALICPVDSFNPSGPQLFSNPLRGKLAAHEKITDSHDVYVKGFGGALVDRITKLEEDAKREDAKLEEDAKRKVAKLEEDAKQKDARFKQRMEQLEKLTRGKVQKAANKAANRADEVEKKVAGLTLQMEEIEKRLKGQDDEVLALQRQCDAVKSQHATIQCELDEMKEHLLDLQATSDATVDWISGNDTILLDRIQLRNLITLAQGQLATAAHLSDGNSVQRASDAWRQKICYNDLSIDDRLALAHSLLPKSILSDSGWRLVVQRPSEIQNEGNAVALTRDRRVYQGAIDRTSSGSERSGLNALVAYIGQVYEPNA